jgi:lipopolysaccharide export system permease protein
MRILTRYVLFEVGFVFLLSLFSLTALIMLVLVAKEALLAGLGMRQMLQLMPYMLPISLLYAVPGTMLFAVTNVFGRMAGSNEIVAIKSMGLNPMIFMWPVLVLAVLLSFLTVWLNDIAMTWSYFGCQQVVMNAIEDIAYSKLEKQKSFSMSGLSVNVMSVVGRKLMGPTFTFRGSGDARTVTITCREAELRSEPGSGVLKIVCRDGTVETDGATLYFNDEIEREIALDGGRKSAVGAAHLGLNVLPDQIIEKRQAITAFEQRMAAESGYQMLTGDFGSLMHRGWEDREYELREMYFQLYRLETEPPRRWANGFSCLCFALVGASLAMHRRNADALATFFTCFGLILVVYYPLLMYGLDRCKCGGLPPYCVWLGNVILLVWGLWMRRKVMRY